MEDGENGDLSNIVFGRTISAEEHEHENATILSNPMEVRIVSEHLLNQGLAPPICVVTFYFSFRS